MLKRTQEEIVARLKVIEERGDDFMGTIRSDMVDYLDYEHAKPFLKEGVTLEQWNDAKQVDPLIELRGYMPFALDKAEGHRGISAGRSIQHMQTWLWLMGDDELLEFAENDNNYPNYGVPILAAICKKYYIQTPDEEWFKNMSQGSSCTPDCDEGCGS